MSRRSAVHTLLAVALLLLAGFSQAPAGDDPATLRNIGRSQYEEEKYADAAQTFEKLVKLRPDSAYDQINLGIVLVQLEKYDEARTRLEKGEALDPSLAPYAAYNIALSYKRQRDFQKAAAAFERARQLDPQNPDTAYNLAVVYEGLGQLDKAFEMATLAAELKPDEVAPHYRRMMIAVRQKNMEVANLEKSRMAELRAQDARNRTPAELEMSIYTEIAEPQRGRAVSGPAPSKPSGVKFVDITETAGLPTSGSPGQPSITWVDINGDTLPDLSVVSSAGLRIWLNSPSGVFKEQPLPADLASLANAGVQAWGDLENDGDKDACVASAGRVYILLNDGKGTLTRGGEIPFDGDISDLLLVDYDHEGDLDLYVAGKTNPPKMYQNDGRGHFAPAPEKTGLSTEKPFARLSFLDFDDDNDTDFLLTAPGQDNVLLSNLRVGLFQDVAKKLGLEAPARQTLITDVNNDQWRDIVFWRDNGEVTADLGTATGPFRPVIVGQVDPKSAALASLDYDNDGDEDLWVGNRLLQNDGSFGDVSAAAGLESLAALSIAEARPCDYDGDGDFDVALALKDGGIRLLKNEGGNKNSWLRVQLDGLQSNRFGVATKVEVRAGEFFQRKIADGNPVLFGLGERKAVDVLRLWWTTGVAQNLLSPAVDGLTVVKEKLGPPSSCPFVYLWDGKKFSFFTDALDLAALGVPLDSHTMLHHVAKEDLLIPERLIRPRQGKLPIQLTGELRELVYLDRVRLSYFDHPKSAEVFNFDFNGSPAHASPDLLEVADLRPPRLARNEAGQDMTADLARQDHVYAKSGIRLTRFNGLAESHRLSLDFGDLSEVRQPVLVLQGWINWIDGDTLFALGQGAASPPAGPSLEIQTNGGPWKKISDNIGTPAGIDKHLILELPRELCGRSTRLRLTTNLELYWDRAAVGDLLARRADRNGEVKLLVSDLHFRGFSAIHRDKAGSPPWYDYYSVSAHAPWKPQRGLLTRYGSVGPLLSKPDDRLVVFGPGDELTLLFDNPPAPAPGMERTYVLHLDGWIKDANSTTRTGDTVEPLPTRDMVNYPFDPEPDLAQTDYWISVEENNTRALRK